MKIVKQVLTALRQITQELFTTTSGRVVLALVGALHIMVWTLDDSEGSGWALVGRLLLAPLVLVFGTAVWQFLAGALFALAHARRPKHSYVVLDLKDGRTRRGMVCAAPCCIRRQIRSAMKSPTAKFIWSIGDGSDDEEFGRDEIDNWAVMPVDDPDPHGTHGERL